ncbi:MAG: hypothetical protein COA79_22485 [Planctomycetota bacterium]|nr:MAG: hypothetical protein COA79_22485 [Planctomycetota bacterium]
MPKFMIAYYGGNKPTSKEEGETQMKNWKSWVEGLGKTIVNPGTPFMGTKIVTLNDVQDETDPNAMKGYAIIESENFEDAIEIAKSDPFLKTEGTVRVSQMMEM